MPWIRRVATGLTLILITAIVPVVGAQAEEELTSPLAQPVWLCKPGMPENPCGQNARGGPQDPPVNGSFAARYLDDKQVPLDATVVAPDDSTAPETFTVADDRPVDCFYAYPTVDLLNNPLLPIGNLPPIPRNNEIAVTLLQAGRFSQVCRLFVPVYRQASLIQLVTGAIIGSPASMAAGIKDVEQAWDQYWANDNTDPVTGKRRGVIFLAHSQGNGGVATVLQKKFDNDPQMRRQLVGAYLLGSNFQVPDDRPAGGGNDPYSSFQHIPACERASAHVPIPTGCVVAYGSFDKPEGQHPSTGDVFGRNGAPGHHNLCTNPAALLAGAPASAVTELDPGMMTRRLLDGHALNPGGHLALLMSTVDLKTYPTGFARYPGQLYGQCKSVDDADGNASWFQITGRISLFPEHDQTRAGGLHLFDYNVALGDLVRLADAQATEWLRGV